MTRIEIDDAINQWARSNNVSILREADPSDRRFFYISGGRECYQIVVEKLDGENISINLWDIETKNDEEFHDFWTGPVENIEYGLSIALLTVQKWINRDPPAR